MSIMVQVAGRAKAETIDAFEQRRKAQQPWLEL